MRNMSRMSKDWAGPPSRAYLDMICSNWEAHQFCGYSLKVNICNSQTIFSMKWLNIAARAYTDGQGILFRIKTSALRVEIIQVRVKPTVIRVFITDQNSVGFDVHIREMNDPQLWHSYWNLSLWIRTHSSKDIGSFSPYFRVFSEPGTHRSSV